MLIVTADHGFTALAPTSERPYPVITFGRDLLRARVNGVHLVADGGVEHVYADAVPAEATTVGADVELTLARVAGLARETPGVTEVLARLPVGGVTELVSAHPDWHLSHERTGELLLVASPGYEFVDPFDPAEASLLGNHGGPGELTVPLVVSGGYAGLRPARPPTRRRRCWSTSLPRSRRCLGSASRVAWTAPRWRRSSSDTRSWPCYRTLRVRTD